MKFLIPLALLATAAHAQLLIHFDNSVNTPPCHALDKFNQAAIGDMSAMMEDMMSQIFDDTPGDIFGDMFKAMDQQMQEMNHGRMKTPGFRGGLLSPMMNPIMNNLLPDQIVITVIEPLDEASQDEISSLKRDDPCLHALRTHCSGVDNAFHATKCLMNHLDDIEGECKQIVSESVFGMCQKDIKSYCDDVKPGHNKLHKCLAAKLSEEKALSDTCLTYLNAGHEKVHTMVKESIESPPVEPVSTRVLAVESVAEPAVVAAPVKMQAVEQKVVTFQDKAAAKIEEFMNSPNFAGMSVLASVGVVAFVIFGVVVFRRSTAPRENSLFDDYRFQMM